MHKVIQNKPKKSLIILPIFGIIILSFLYINIYVGNALMNSSAITEGYELSVQNNTTLRIELPTTTPISVTPTVAGQFNSQTLPVNVISDYVNGYTLTMSASTSSLSRSEAVNGKTYEIPTLTSNVDESNNPYTCTVETSETCNFPKNYWGLKRSTSQISDSGYIPLIANVNMPVNITSAPADESISNIDFGVKLSNATPNGIYNITLNFLAVTNISPNLYYMQDATSTSLAAAMPSVGDTTVLYDRRDNKEYTVAKLADGKYWMTKNLDLDGGTPLYSSDSDVPAGYDAEPYYTLPASQKITSGTTLDGGFNNDAGEYVFNSSNKTDSCGSGCYSYYSWNAATAMSGTNISADNTDAPYSICPAGWRLPTSRTTVELATGIPGSDFYKMSINYGLNSTNLNENPDNEPKFCNLGGDCSTNTVPRFLRAGYYNGSTFYRGGTSGHYWPSTVSSSTYAHNLYFDSGSVYSASHDYRRYGFSVRCLFDATMQNFTSEDADAMALHQEEVLVDARDGKNYYVAKLKDGNVWMTQNLDLDLDSSVALTNADTDLNSVTSWTPIRSTIDASSNSMKTYPDSASNWASGWINDDNTPYSVDAGYKYILPIEKTSSGNGAWNDQPYDTAYNSLAECQTAASDPNKNSFGLACDGHTSVGNYYNFAAANATNNVETTLGGGTNVAEFTVMPDSICPVGWRLPKNNSSNYKNDFAVLIGNENFESGYNLYASFNPSGLNAIRKAPLYFVRSGYTEAGWLGRVGVQGGAWASTISDIGHGTNLAFTSSGPSIPSKYAMHYGYPVRCLLRTE